MRLRRVLPVHQLPTLSYEAVRREAASADRLLQRTLIAYVRLKLDSSMDLMGWSRQQAREYMRENSQAPGYQMGLRAEGVGRVRPPL